MVVGNAQRQWVGIDLQHRPQPLQTAEPVDPVAAGGHPWPASSYKVLATLAPALSGFAAYLALRRWVRVGPAALGGLLDGFGPVVVGAAAVHIHLEFAVFPPLAIALLDNVFVRQQHPRRNGILLGLAAGLQLLVSTEVLLTTAIAALVGLAVAALVDRGSVRAAAPQAARGLLCAAAVAVPLAAAPLAVQFLGGQRPSGALQAPALPCQICSAR